MAAILFTLVGAAMVAAGWYYVGCREAPDPTGREVPFLVIDGASGHEVLADLAGEGLVRCDGFVGDLLLRGTGRAGEIRAGSYDLSVGMSLDQILDVITSPPPQVPTVRLTIAEGLRIRSTFPGERSIASEVHEQLGLSESRFVAVAEGGGLSLPPYLSSGTSTAEGFLFPNTYRFVREGLTVEDVVHVLLDEFQKEAALVSWDRAEELGVTRYQAVIVASMIEREAAVDSERPLIAGVIYNRLEVGMALGIDATLLYDDPSPDGYLSTSDIETDGPYNTRLRAGLPPTPISSPGLESLRAALSPAHTEFLYYVLCPPDGDGLHRFAKTYEEHLANVRECLG